MIFIMILNEDLLNLFILLRKLLFKENKLLYKIIKPLYYEIYFEIEIFYGISGLTHKIPVITAFFKK